MSLPGGSVSSVISITTSTTNSKPAGYSSNFNLNAGSVQVVSYDAPSCSPRDVGAFTVSGGVSFSWSDAVVESVDMSASVNEMVTYTTTLRLMELP